MCSKKKRKNIQKDEPSKGKQEWLGPAVKSVSYEYDSIAKDIKAMSVTLKRIISQYISIIIHRFSRKWGNTNWGNTLVGDPPIYGRYPLENSSPRIDSTSGRYDSKQTNSYSAKQRRHCLVVFSKFPPRNLLIARTQVLVQLWVSWSIGL